MNKTITFLILALVCVVSKAQMNPRMSQLFDELTAMGKSPFGRTSSIIKRGGMDKYGNRPEMEYSLRLFYRPDIIRGRKDSLFVDSVLQVQKTLLERQVKAIRRTLNALQKEAQDSCHYESHTGGKDTIFYSLNLSHDTSRIYKYQEGNYTYFNSDEFLYFVLESGKKEDTYEGHLKYTVSLPRIDLSPTFDVYTWKSLKADIEGLFDKHGIGHRNSLWQHDIVYSDSVWNAEMGDWIGMGTYGDNAKSGVTEAKIYSLSEEQEPLARQLLSQIDSLAQKFTEKQQECYYQYNYGVTFNGFTPQILACYASHIPMTNSIQVHAADHGFQFLLLETRGAEWIPAEFLSLKSIINGKKTYFEGMKPKKDKE